MAKIAVLISDFFWSSIPYDGLTLCIHLREKFGKDVDLLMFSNDIRLNKTFDGKKECFYRFSPNLFTRQNPILLKNWDEFFLISENYKLILCQTHITVRGRHPENFKTRMKCPFMLWDIGGSDILTMGDFGTHFCVKGEIWRDWLIRDGISLKNIFVTGTPHYDYYLHNDKILLPEAKILSNEEFYNKYKIPHEKRLLLIAPSNPGSHKEQFSENLKSVEKLVKMAEVFNYQAIIKTYPNDYLFYDTSSEYSGIYHRIYTNKPQYHFLKKKIPQAKIIESQDHFGAILYSDKLYNMSGSHLAWETYYSNCQAYATNYKNKPYYGGAKYLPGVVLPDDYFNVHLDRVEEMFTLNQKTKKNCHEYMSKKFAHEAIVSVAERFI